MSTLFLLLGLALCAETNGKPLPGATVILLDSEGGAAAATAGSDGCARVDLAAGTYRVTVTAPESMPADLEIVIPDGDEIVSRTVSLTRVQAEIEEIIVIEAEREHAEETRHVITPEVARMVPGSQGDALKAVQNLPGLARSSFGMGALIVRGAAPEDTKVFLDGQEIPQLYHFGGLTSVVSTEMLQSIDFLPGGFGVRYGGATSGVVDVETKGGDEKKHGGHFDADIYDAEAVAQGPAGKDSRHGKVIGAVRRSYIDTVLPLVVPADQLQLTVAPRYYDYQLRYDAPTRDNGLQAPVTMPLANGWILGLTPSIGFQDFAVDAGGNAKVSTQKTDGSARLEARGAVSESVAALVGVETTVEQLAYDATFIDDTAGPREDSTGERTTIVSEKDRYPGACAAIYAQTELKLGALTLVPGLRVDGYAPANQVSFDPRIAARLRASETVSFKAYTGLYHQPPQVREWDSKVGNPDLRTPYALQAGAGMRKRFGELNSIEGEIFWKWMGDQIVQAPADPGVVNARTSYTNEEMGRAYGAEVLVKREMGEKTFGWIAYTLSRSERADPYTEGGWRPYQYDQTHILTTVVGRQLPRGWNIGLRFRYTTGNPTEYVESTVYDADSDSYVPVNGARRLVAAPRLPPARRAHRQEVVVPPVVVLHLLRPAERLPPQQRRGCALRLRLRRAQLPHRPSGPSFLRHPGRILMKTSMKIGVLAMSAVLLAGCAEDPEERALVNQLKVLGMRADFPETQPGTTVTLDALVADPLGGGRGITRAWSICDVDQAEGTASCAEPERLTSLGAADTATLEIPADALAALPEAQQISGIEIAVVLTITAGAETDTAIKRVRVSTSATPNRNPAFRELTIAGVVESPTIVQAGSEVEVVAAADATSLESYVDEIGQPQVARCASPG